MNGRYYIVVYEYIGNSNIFYGSFCTQRTINRLYNVPEKPLQLSESLWLPNLIYTNPQDVGE